MTIPPTADIAIETTSEVIPNWEASGQAPTITMNGAPFAQLAPPEFSSGFQLVVINSTADLTDPANIVLNYYIQLQSDDGLWDSTYGYMYIQMVNAILTAGNTEQQLLLIASFGMDAGAQPTTDALGFLLARGAGPGIQQWDLMPDRGSQGNGWVSAPVSYILVGGSAYGYGAGAEALVANGGEPAPASVSVSIGNNVPPPDPPAPVPTPPPAVNAASD
jgi:hypothetical protein